MSSTRNLRIAKNIFKAIFFIILIFVCTVLGFRMCSMNNMPDGISEMLVDDALYDAYKKQDGKLEMFTQNYDIFTRADYNYSYFAVPEAVFIPEAEQLQIIFRYNDSTIQHLATDYSLPELPSKESELFKVSIVKIVDLTPDDTSDNKDMSKFESQRFFPSEVVYERTSRHTYARMIFNGISADDAYEILADIHYVEALDYEQASYGAVLVYHCEKTRLEVKPDKALLEKLESYK